MRIAQISTLATPVLQIGGGSVEHLVWLLTRELVSLGHEVTVFGAGGSVVPGELVATLPGSYATKGTPCDWQLCEWMNLCAAVAESGRFDLLHSHAYLWGLPLERFSKARMLHTMHVLPHEDQANLWGRAPDAFVSAISRFQWSRFPQHEPAAVIHPGVDVAQLSFSETTDDYLCYLGRFTAGKGPIQAIEAAKKSGVRLVLAGPMNDYYRRHVAPLVDGVHVQYAGSVSGDARSRLLGRARVLLYPIQEPEPFGLVLVEAMMCGTPVAALARGAVSEIVEDGVTGACVAAEDELPKAVARAWTLDRAAVRARAEALFTASRMAREYEQLYVRMLT